MSVDQPGETSRRAFARDKRFDYLASKDRYLSACDEPQFRFGFIGCGIMGLEHMLNTRLEGRASVAAIYDPAPQSIEYALTRLGQDDAHAPPRVHESLADICADPDLDALLIATPNHTHLDVLRSACRSGKAIFLEKPIATTIEDAYEVCRLAAEHPNLVRIGLQYRYKAIYAEALAEVLERGSVGNVHQINISEHRFPFLDKVNQWNKFNDLTGGTLVEKCCHYFDLINLFSGGTPTQVYASGGQAANFRHFSYDNKAADGLDHANVIINYDNGVVGGFSLCMFTPGSFEELVVCGSEGRLSARESATLGEENDNALEIWRGESGASRRSKPTYPSYIARAGHHGSTFFEHVAFVDDLITGQNQGPSLAEGFWAIVVGIAAQTSIATGQAVDIESLLPDHLDQTIFNDSTTASAS